MLADGGNLSFGSRRRRSISSVSVCSSTVTSSHSTTPHKANHAAWEAMRWLCGYKGQVGLDHFCLLRRLDSDDVGNVYLCQIRNPLQQVELPPCFYAMKVVDREALAIRNKLQRAEMEKEILEFCPSGDLYAAQQCQLRRRFGISSAKQAELRTCEEERDVSR